MSNPIFTPASNADLERMADRFEEHLRDTYKIPHVKHTRALTGIAHILGFASRQAMVAAMEKASAQDDLPADSQGEHDAPISFADQIASTLANVSSGAVLRANLSPGSDPDNTITNILVARAVRLEIGVSPAEEPEIRGMWDWSGFDMTSDRSYDSEGLAALAALEAVIEADTNIIDRATVFGATLHRELASGLWFWKHDATGTTSAAVFREGRHAASHFLQTTFGEYSPYNEHPSATVRAAMRGTVFFYEPGGAGFAKGWHWMNKVDGDSSPRMAGFKTELDAAQNFLFKRDLNAESQTHGPRPGPRVKSHLIVNRYDRTEVGQIEDIILVRTGMWDRPWDVAVAFTDAKGRHRQIPEADVIFDPAGVSKTPVQDECDHGMRSAPARQIVRFGSTKTSTGDIHFSATYLPSGVWHLGLTLREIEGEFIFWDTEEAAMRTTDVPHGLGDDMMRVRHALLEMMSDADPIGEVTVAIPEEAVNTFLFCARQADYRLGVALPYRAPTNPAHAGSLIVSAMTIDNLAEDLGLGDRILAQDRVTLARKLGLTPDPDDSAEVAAESCKDGHQEGADGFCVRCGVHLNMVNEG